MNSDSSDSHHGSTQDLDVAVIGGGSSGQAAAARAEQTGKSVPILDAHAGDEVVAI